ncbi:PHO85 cyclin-1 [Massospora cicadina]|nr:PHO85 cyclin-1 [Massospora cicadina]
MSLSVSTYSLTQFAYNVFVSSQIQPSTLFGAMVYLERLDLKLGSCLAINRVFTPYGVLLASLILAGKFLNDYSPKNRHWAAYSGLFTFTSMSLDPLSAAPVWGSGKLP